MTGQYIVFFRLPGLAMHGIVCLLNFSRTQQVDTKLANHLVHNSFHLHNIPDDKCSCIPSTLEKLATPLMGMISDQICTPLSSTAINKMGNVGSTYTFFPSIFITSVHPPTPHLFFSVGASAMTQ